MKAGTLDDSYNDKIQTFDWRKFFEEKYCFFSDWIEYLENNFDYILIDSRTGLTDISGLCTMVMPERIVTVFTPNNQSLDNLINILDSWVAYRLNSDDFRPFMIYPLPSRIEFNELDLYKKWQDRYIEAFEEKIKVIYGISNCNLKPYFDSVAIHYIPKYAYGEEISVIKDGVNEIENSVFNIGKYFDLAKAIVSDENLWDYSHKISKNYADAIDRINQAYAGNLIFLDLGGLDLISIPKEISKLAKLKSLILSNNQIEDIEYISSLLNLQELYLNNNKIADISLLERLPQLQRLDLSDNKISSIDILRNHARLKYLDVSKNFIKKIPSAIFHLEIRIRLKKNTIDGLYLHDNPIESPPVEILYQGRRSVLAWFDATVKTLSEIKVILIGDPKAGKTSLLRRLKDDTFDQREPQTDGINIEHIPFGSNPHFKNQKSLHQLTAHCWDFGGQEIMNATHQFFLTNRSVYLLVLDARRDQKVAEHVRMWVKRIKATGGNSPIIVVANQADVNPGFGFSNEIDLQKEFPQVKYFLKVSCLNGDGIDAVKQKLEELIPKAELFNTAIDERWISIMKQLQAETQTKHYLSEERFNQICDDNELPKSGRSNAINFLNDLGLVLHFDSLTLADYYVLDPHWITYGIYQIVTSAYAGDQKGKVPLDKLDYILNEEKDKKQVYQPAQYRKLTYETASQRRFLVDILNQFKLCFYLANGEHFIIPDLLDTTEPVAVTRPIRDDAEAISFVYDYEYMPSSVMPRIMVDGHGLLKQKWRTGCVLQYNNCNALVSCYQNRLTITVQGQRRQKREFLAVIRNMVDEINKDLTGKPKMLVPLPGITNAFAEYQVLLNRERKGRKEYVHDGDKDTEKVFELSQLLEGIPGNDEMRELFTISRKILASTERIEITLDEQFHYLVKRSGIDSNKIIDAVVELTKAQQDAVMNDIMTFISGAFEIQHVEIDKQLQKIYADLSESDDVEMKLKLSIPFLNLLGVELETEVDVKSWAKKMDAKYGWTIFRMLS